MRSTKSAVFAFVLGVAAAVPVEAQDPKFQHRQGGQYEGSYFLDQYVGFLAGDSRIHRTENGGEDWDEVSFVDAETNEEIRVPLRGMFIVEDVPDVLGWCVGDGGVVLTTDSSNEDGEVWRDLNGGNRVLNVCGEPAVLYDIFMLESTDYQVGYCVGEDGAIAVTTDGGETWDNIADEVNGVFSSCSSHDPYDAYVVHFFSDPGSGEEFERGIIASEHGLVVTTADGGETWSPVYVDQDPGVTDACPAVGGNLEWWGMDFEDPTDPTSPVWLVGGMGVNKGYLYWSSGMQTSGQYEDTWEDTWQQVRCYEFQDPDGTPLNPNVCGASTQYGVAVLSAGVPVSVGYGSQLFEFGTGMSNFDPCTCNDVPLSTCGSAVWLEQELPVLAGNPFLATVAKVTSTVACTAGAFGRIALYDASTNEAEDHGSTVPSRIHDAAFVDATTGCVFGQGFAVNYTEDGGMSFQPALVDWTFDGSGEGRGIAFDSSGTHGVAVGDNGAGSTAFIARTTDTEDAWMEWTFVEGPEDIPNLQAVTFVPGLATVFAVGLGGHVLKSTNYGEDWDVVSDLGGNGPDLYGVSFADEDIGYIVGENRKAYKTDDGGETWSAISAGSGDTIFDVQTWGDGSEAILVGQNGGVWRYSPSQPRIESLAAEIGFDVTQHLYDVEVLDSGDTIRIGGDLGFVLFGDSGTWTKPRSGTALPITKMAFQSWDEGFAIAWMFVVLRYE